MGYKLINIKRESVYKEDANEDANEEFMPFGSSNVIKYKHKIKFNNPFERIEIQPFDFAIRSEHNNGKFYIAYDILFKIYGDKIKNITFNDVNDNEKISLLEANEKLGMTSRYKIYKVLKNETKLLRKVGVGLYTELYK